MDSPTNPGYVAVPDICTRNCFTPAQAAAVAAHAPATTRRQLARHFCLSWEVSVELFFDPDEITRDHAASMFAPNGLRGLDVELIERALQPPYPDLLIREAARSKHATTQHLLRIVEFGHSPYIGLALRHRAADEKVVRAAFATVQGRPSVSKKWAVVWRRIAAAPAAPADILTTLATVGDAKTREYVAKRALVDEELQRLLAADPDERVAFAAANATGDAVDETLRVLTGHQAESKVVRDLLERARADGVHGLGPVRIRRIATLYDSPAALRRALDHLYVRRGDTPPFPGVPRKTLHALRSWIDDQD